MRTIGNVIWLILGGLLMGLAWFLVGAVLCITVVGIPFGVQCFKFARINLSPFGKEVRIEFEEHPVMNIIWLIFFGWEMALSYLAMGIACCITVIGIPFGLQALKMMRLAVFPFGADLIDAK